MSKFRDEDEFNIDEDQRYAFGEDYDLDDEDSGLDDDEDYEDYEVLSDPWTSIIARAPQYHGIKIRNRPHKAKRTYEELISVVCDNWSDVIAKCPQAKRFDEDVRRFLIK